MSMTRDKHSLVSDQISFAGLFVRCKGQEEVGVVKLKERRAIVPGPGATAGALLTQMSPLSCCAFVVCSFVGRRKIHSHTETDHVRVQISHKKLRACIWFLRSSSEDSFQAPHIRRSCSRWPSIGDEKILRSSNS
jgi:hypothetical protein